MRRRIVYSTELYHYGIPGMKWGTWNDETRARYLGIRKARRKNSSKNGNNSRRKKIARTVLVAGGATLAVAATAYALRHPELKNVAIYSLLRVGSVTSKTLKVASDSLKQGIKKSVSDAPKKLVSISSKVLKSTAKGFEQGVKEGLSEGPKKLGKAVAIGGYMVAGKLALDQILGKDVSNAIFKANDKKSIGKFWNGLPVASEEDSDD